MRKLKFHEKKLMKKVSLVEYPKEHNSNELTIMNRYRLNKREEYIKYNQMCGMVTKVAERLKKLPPTDAFRMKYTDMLLEKLYAMGLITSKKSLQLMAELNASSFCRRRLPVVLCRLKFCENITVAKTMINHGHIRVGPEVVTDDAFLVTRAMEDYITWTDSSKVKQKVLKYNNKLDDYDLLEAL
eukprot:TRINITY_DN11921_c0_g1_i1.p1 TRINITY_DN11921_c0_g1~~TRINITY_DN11921_c0_g1_i1.p1  ORF type:complete len:185 (+),score=42.57 TRINITY_DN11921_c0_g1_i1:50-604(+)